MAAKLKKDDEVIVIAGKDKGKKGKIMRMIPTENRVVVAGVNMVKRHQKPDRVNAGGIVMKEASLHISNVMLVDPKEGKPTRVGFKVMKDGKKSRVAKRSGEVVGA
jgi:large subunit ribosomal protein L24